MEYKSQNYQEAVAVGICLEAMENLEVACEEPRKASCKAYEDNVTKWTSYCILQYNSYYPIR